MYAGVPCYNLKALHQATADDMPKPRTLLGAWREMRETWKRQLTDPDEAFDTPLPSRSEVGEARPDSSARSIGDLGPKEFDDNRVAEPVPPRFYLRGMWMNRAGVIGFGDMGSGLAKNPIQQKFETMLCLILINSEWKPLLLWVGVRAGCGRGGPEC